MAIIRDATLDDAGRILEIYDYYVRETAVTFECETPSLEAFRDRMRGIMARYPYLVAIEDSRVVGYAYAGPFSSRSGYDWSSEASIYLDRDARGRGLGRALYAALEDALKGMGIVNLYVRIAYPEQDDDRLTKNSAEFHAHIGFSRVGEFRRSARKFGHWYGMVYMEKTIGEHSDDQPPVAAYNRGC